MVVHVDVVVVVDLFIYNLKHKCFYNDNREHENVNCKRIKNAWL